MARNANYPPLLSALAALLGALIRGGASLAAAIYTQRYQDRQQRAARETTKREVVYADFIMSASKLLLKAHLSGGLTLGGDEQYLIGLANRMRLFAPPNVVQEAEAVIRGVINAGAKCGPPETHNGRSVQKSKFRFAFAN